MGVQSKQEDVVLEQWNLSVNRGIVTEIRRTRERRGWSREQLAEKLPSGVGARTVLAYEHGTRQLTATRFVEICEALEVSPPTVLQQALQRARLNLAHLTLQVDLHALIKAEHPTYRPMMQWARNTLNENPEGTVELEPATVRHLAYSSGFAYRDLANYLARFIPETDSHTRSNNKSPKAKKTEAAKIGPKGQRDPGERHSHDTRLKHQKSHKTADDPAG